MIRCILFDMGNVLIKFQPHLFIERLGLTGEDAETIYRELFQEVEWVMCDRGTLDERETAERAARRVPEHLRGYLEPLATAWNRPEDQIAGMQEIAAELAENGYELYLFTNAGPRHRAYWQTFPIAVYFPRDRVFLSADYGLLKPEPEFYETAVERFSLRKEECLFIDDNTINAEAATRCGIDTIVFHNDARELRRKLRDKGIDISL